MLAVPVRDLQFYSYVPMDNMLFAYIPADGVYLVHKDPESLDEELCFRFPEDSHPLNTRLAEYFQNHQGFFHYQSPIMYTADPFQLISIEGFPELRDLALRIDQVNDMKRKVKSETD
jgi:hypothetical protein